MQSYREESVYSLPLTRPRARAESDPAAAQDSPQPSALRRLYRPLWLLAICAAIVLLRETREVLVPIILAILLTLVLSGLVEWLRRWHVPRALSAVVLLSLGAVALGAGVDALWAPAQEWVQNAPRVLRVIEHKVRPARAVVMRLSDIANRASALTGTAPDNRSATGTATGSTLTTADVLSQTGAFASSVVMVAVLTLFLLSGGPPTLAHMTAALGGNWKAVHVLRTIDAIRVQVGRYYGTLALINISLGMATALAMWALEMPNPILWGALAAGLNFIPYLGSAITLLIISVVALVTFDSIPHALLVAGCYLGIATVEGQIVEPFCFGRRLHLNPIIILVSLWVGGWLWGVAGVVFALPVLLAAKVAASQAGNHGVVARFLGPAAPQSREESDAVRVAAPTEDCAHGRGLASPDATAGAVAR